MVNCTDFSLIIAIPPGSRYNPVSYTHLDQVDPKLTIYSIVNSITASGSAGKVQILVNGETNLSYQETIDISQPFSMNADLIEEEE